MSLHYLVKFLAPVWLTATTDQWPNLRPFCTHYVTSVDVIGGWRGCPLPPGIHMCCMTTLRHSKSEPPLPCEWTSFLTEAKGDNPNRNRSICGQLKGSFWFTGKESREEYLYSAFYKLCISQSTQAWITQFYLKIHNACLSFVSVHEMTPTLTEVRDIQLQLTTHLSTQRDERLSWPSWLTYRGRFTDISGHPPATGRA